MKNSLIMGKKPKQADDFDILGKLNMGGNMDIDINDPELMRELKGMGWDDDDMELASMVGAIITTATKGNSKATVSLVDPSAFQLGMSYAACMKTDRDDGLFATVVCTRSGEALGLVYSSKVQLLYLEIMCLQLGLFFVLTHVCIMTGIHGCVLGVWSWSVLFPIEAGTLEEGRHIGSLSNASQS